jgi:signal peptidase I
MQWFEIALVSLTLLSGVIWLLDRLFFAKRRLPAADGRVREPMVVDYSRAFFPVLLVVLLLRSFIAEPFRIPSSSMMPSLLIGDFILVNKFSYGLRLPITNQKFLAIGEPKRGDVVVFHFPGFPCQVDGHMVRSGDRSCLDPNAPVPNENWIKRVIGLPGDTIAYHDHVVYLNGKPLAYRDDGVYEGKGTAAEATGDELKTEELPGHPHPVLVDPNAPLFTQGEGEWVVPPGHYFVMGDNRDNSEDGRFWGFLPEDKLRGRAFLVWMSFADGLDVSRIGNRVP